MWKLKEQAEGQNKMENALKIKAMLEALPPQIPQLKSLEVGVNIQQSEAAFDLVLITVFDNQDDGVIYQNHPAHQAVSAFVGKVRADRHVVDFTF